MTESLLVKAGYVGTKSSGLDAFRYNNQPRPGPGDVQSRRPFPNLSTIRLSKSEGFATYHGLELGAQKRFAKGLSFTTGYTWARTIDNGGIYEATLNPYNTVNDKALSSFHRAHRYFLSGVWEVPYGRGRAVRDEHQSHGGCVPGRLAVEQLPGLRDGNPDQRHHAAATT